MSSTKTIETSVAELILSLSSLIRFVRASAPAEISDLTWTQKSVINRLYEEGPLTTAELARSERVKSQSMSTALAALEELRIIERKAHPTDGRQMNIGLTAIGKTMRKSTRETHNTWLLQAVKTLDKKDQDTLFAAGAIIKRLIKS